MDRAGEGSLTEASAGSNAASCFGIETAGLDAFVGQQLEFLAPARSSRHRGG